MNRLTITACMALAAMGTILTGCSENERLDYALDDRVYFHETTMFVAQETNVWERSFSFALLPSSIQQDTLKVAVRLMGRTADHDRTFRAVAVADSTTAESPLHYELLPGVIRAGEQDGYLPVLVKRTADTQDHEVTLYLELVESDELGTGNADALHFRLTWADMLLRPANWPYYFGQYSTSKYRFAIDVLGITDWPQATRFNNGSEPGLFTMAQLQLFASQLNEAYEEYRKNNGPIYVDDEAEEKQEIYYAAGT